MIMEIEKQNKEQNKRNNVSFLLFSYLFFFSSSLIYIILGKREKENIRTMMVPGRMNEVVNEIRRYKIALSA